MIRGIHHVGVNCRDLARMTRFYCEAFGFAPVDEGFGWADEPVMDRIVDVAGSAAKGVMLRAGSAISNCSSIPLRLPTSPGRSGPTIAAIRISASM
ncbi:VOC family protein [Novosphingobium sp. ST904]|uniref:VOC family protein n=1 Tax=Novosphingobium sp. ST904 TaxID=1684385 RepID=UPI000A988599|nr:VOC family protein [Novosphingobium sp. ST904]